MRSEAIFRGKGRRSQTKGAGLAKSEATRHPKKERGVKIELAGGKNCPWGKEPDYFRESFITGGNEVPKGGTAG